MQLRHRVALDGVQLDSVDSRIMIQRIETGDGKENISAVSLMGGSGSRVTNIHRDSIEITVKFCIRLKSGTWPSVRKCWRRQTHGHLPAGG